MKHIEEAVAYLESMFSEYPNPTRKVGYIGKIAEWGLKPEQVDELISKAVDRFTTFPTIRHLIDLRDELFSTKTAQADAEVREAKEKAGACYNLHERGLCGSGRGKKAECQHCDGREFPGARPETISEMLGLYKRFKGDELKAKSDELSERMRIEANEDRKIFFRKNVNQKSDLKLVKP